MFMNLETWLWQRAWTLYLPGSWLPWGLAVESLFLWTPLGTGCQLLTELTTYVDLPWDGHGLLDYLTTITWLHDYLITGSDHPDGRSLLRSDYWTTGSNHPDGMSLLMSIKLAGFDTAAWSGINVEHSSIENCWLLVSFMVSNIWWIFVLLK